MSTILPLTIRYSIVMIVLAEVVRTYPHRMDNDNNTNNCISCNVCKWINFVSNPPTSLGQQRHLCVSKRPIFNCVTQ